jgi:DNA-binding transcriptional LysR family regulator
VAKPYKNSMHNQLLAIRSFARVVETGSFTRAADSLDMPKATVSKLVRELEAHLGVRLLQRTTRRVQVTDDGNSYYDRTARLIREIEEIDRSLSGAHKKPRGKIRVDVGGSPGRMILLPALPDFFARYPDMQIDLGVSDRSVDLIAENVDCVIRGGRTNEPSFVSRLLGTASFTTCATPDYLRKFGRPRHPRELLTKHRIVAYRSALTGRPLQSHFERGKERFDIDSPYSVSVNDGGARALGGLYGLGITQTFTYIVKEHLATGALVPILEDWAPPRYPFHVVYPQNLKLSNRVRVFIDWLATVFAGLD